MAEELGDDLPNTRTIGLMPRLERATGARKDDTRSDIYFMGCMFYHMLTGQSPLMETRNRLQRMNKQRFLDVVPDPESATPPLPHWVTKRWVNKAMMLEGTGVIQSPVLLRWPTWPLRSGN